MENQNVLKELAEYKDEWQYHEEGDYWSLEGIPYCRQLRAPDLQCMNIYVPGAYRNGDGTWNLEKTCGDYAVKTAPIIFENGIGGYAESRPLKLALSKEGRSEFMDAGMVFVSPGARGKQTADADGRLIGKSPAGLADLKSAVRYLRHCKGQIPGDTERIISMGVSAGGAMSSLLGATGNSRRYDPYLAENGAYMEERDDIYGAQCYCPIIDLEHADMAYEWMFRGVSEFEGRPSMGGGTLNEFQMALSGKLADRYISYFNSMGLRDPKSGRTLTFSEDGNSGTTVEFLLNVLGRAASKYMKKLSDGSLGCGYSADEYLDGRYTYMKRRPPREKGGAPVYEELAGCEKRSWLSWDGKEAKVKSLREMEKEYLKRLKPCTSFDSLDCTQAENQEFGDENRDYVHFDRIVGEILEELKESYPEDYEKYRKEYEGIDGDEALKKRIYLLNPFNFIGTREVVSTAPHYRIRVGTRDGHTSFTMAMTLALKLMNAEASDVDYAMVWEAEHEKADYAGEFVAWVRRITASDL